MVSANIVLNAPSGLHARPAGELVKLVKSFAGTAVTLGTEVRTVNAASMLSVLSLGLKSGTTLTVSADGPQESEALEAICNFIGSIAE